ncbi:glycoside hydrolase family 71 protein [Calocera cornea HHB12733]|uniref:Glycoside hydrolase family 71 protein n=1 Tax=Calocera cornea HHB12733 TaxID=1353952 RepID=A0A165HA38_9BASI|nr:glycoside hydrolase family 71 protein [Calocera cornea HHB12733]
MVGNTYSYTQDTWASDIQLAHSKGIDAFALNFGSDDWQPQRIADAYAAAEASGTGFKLFVSMDMTVNQCASTGNADSLFNTFVGPYLNHPNQMQYQGKPIVSTFSGENCMFGQSDTNSGWLYFTSKGSMFFLPAFNNDPKTAASWSAVDGLFPWNSGWNYQPQNEAVIDATVIAELGNKPYMAAVSPAFFTHYGADSFNKNWVFPSDAFWYANRWALLVSQRNMFDLIEITTWNDYGESSYVGPLNGAMPTGTTWATGYDHTPLLDVASYYITAFKTGNTPDITQDAIYIWSRPHLKDASAPDPIGKPDFADSTDDLIYALVFATSSADVQVCAGSNCQSFTANPGVNQFTVGMNPGSGMSATLSRNGQTVVSVDGGDFVVEASPSLYNYNIAVVGATGNGAPNGSSSSPGSSGSDSSATSSSSSASATSTSPSKCKA